MSTRVTIITKQDAYTLKAGDEVVFYCVVGNPHGRWAGRVEAVTDHLTAEEAVEELQLLVNRSPDVSLGAIRAILTRVEP